MIIPLHIIIYRSKQNVNCDDNFLNEAIAEKSDLETNILNSNLEHNIMLNGIISVDEVEKVVIKLKKKKAVGVDCIPNEVLKSPGIYCYFIVY